MYVHVHVHVATLLRYCDTAKDIVDAMRSGRKYKKQTSLRIVKKSWQNRTVKNTRQIHLRHYLYNKCHQNRLNLPVIHKQLVDIDNKFFLNKKQDSKKSTPHEITYRYETYTHTQH